MLDETWAWRREHQPERLRTTPTCRSTVHLFDRPFIRVSIYSTVPLLYLPSYAGVKDAGRDVGVAESEPARAPSHRGLRQLVQAGSSGPFCPPWDETGT